MAEHAHTTPAPCRLGHHPRRTDHPALLHADGTVAATFALDATRAEIAAKLGERGLVLRDDDTVTQAAAEPAPTRRRLLSACAGAAFAGAALVIAMPDAPAAEHPDAELLAALAEFDALEVQIHPPTHLAPQTFEAEQDFDNNIEPLRDRQRVVLAQICTLRATTPEGWQARARSFVVWKEGIGRPPEKDNPDGYHDGRMIAALIRDLVGERVA